MDPGRLPRRRGLLRHQWLPDHRAAAGGASPAGPRRSQGLLAAARPPAAPSVVPLARGHARGRRRVSARGGREAAQRRGCCVRLRDQLVPGIQQRVLLRDRRPAVAAAAPLVARGRGAILRVVAAAIRRRDDALAPLHVARRARGRGGVGLADGDPLPARRRSLAHLLRDRYPGHWPPPRSRTRLRVTPRRGTDLTLMKRFAAARRRQLRHASRQRQFRARWGWSGPLLLDVVGLAALGGLVSFCILLDQYQPFLYQGGLALVALTTVVVIMVTVHPHTRLGAGLLGRWPLRWIGLRSYGIYLWHWPVFMVTRPELDVLITGTPLLILRLAATLVLADLSYRFVETPIRRGALGRAWKALREARGARRWWLGAGWAGAVGAGAASCVVLGVALAYAQPQTPPSYLSVESIHTEASAPTPDTRDLGATSETETPETGTAASITSETDTVDLATAPEAAAERAPASRVTAIGDSVMIGATGELEQTIDNLSIEADVGLQAPAATDILRKRRAANQLGEVVVVHIGSNGAFSEEQFGEMMEVLAAVHRVVFVNVKVPRPWEQPNNAVLADGIQQYSNVVLVDWYVASVGRPELFVKDGIHLQHEGQRVYTDLIAEYLEAP